MLRRPLFSFLLLSVWTGHGVMTGAERDIGERIAARDFPSVFQAWSPADNLPGENDLVTAARHDLIWHGTSWYGLIWDKSPSGLGESIRPQSIENGLRKRRKLLELNPNLILIAEIRYRDAPRSFLPENHRWWRRNKDGTLSEGWSEGAFLQLDFDNGTAVYNPMGNKTVTVTFDQPRTGAATDKTSKRHTLKSPDGNIYLKRIKQKQLLRCIALYDAHLN